MLDDATPRTQSFRFIDLQVVGGYSWPKNSTLELDARALFGALHANDTLQYFQADFNKLGCTDVRIFAQVLTTHPSLREFKFSCRKYSPGGLVALVNGIQESSLQKLTLSVCDDDDDFGDNQRILLEAIYKCSTLTHVRLEQMDLEHSDLCDFLGRTSLVQFVVPYRTKSTYWSREEWKTLCKVLHTNYSLVCPCFHYHLPCRYGKNLLPIVQRNRLKRLVTESECN